MAHLLKKKLNSNHGASMILALALFLICTMVSSVIIAAAASGVSRNAKRAEQQAGYLAVSSASDLIVEELRKDGKYIGNSQKKRYGCQDCTIEATMEFYGMSVTGYRLDAEYIPPEDPLDDGHLMMKKLHEAMTEVKSTDNTNTSLNGVFGDLFVRASEHVFMYGSAYSEKITIELTNEDEKMPAVNCQFTMDNSYSVRFILSTEYSDYSITIEAYANIEESNPIETFITDKDDPQADIHTLYYKNFNEETGAFEDAEDTSFPVPVKITSVITTVDWSDPIVEKGVLSQ